MDNENFVEEDADTFTPLFSFGESIFEKTHHLSLHFPSITNSSSIPENDELDEANTTVASNESEEIAIDDEYSVVTRLKSKQPRKRERTLQVRIKKKDRDVVGFSEKFMRDRGITEDDVKQTFGTLGAKIRGGDKTIKSNEWKTVWKVLNSKKRGKRMTSRNTFWSVLSDFTRHAKTKFKFSSEYMKNNDYLKVEKTVCKTEKLEDVERTKRKRKNLQRGAQEAAKTRKMNREKDKIMIKI